MSRRQLEDVAIDGLRCWDISGAKVLAENGFVDAELRSEGGVKGFQFRRKREIAVDLAVIEGLFTHPITYKPELSFAAIPKTEGKHSLDFRERALEPPRTDGLDQNLGVGVASPDSRSA